MIWFIVVQYSIVNVIRVTVTKGWWRCPSSCLQPTCEVSMLFMQVIMWVNKGVPATAAWVGTGSDARACLDLVLDIVQDAIMVLQLISWLQWIVMHSTCAHCSTRAVVNVNNCVDGEWRLDLKVTINVCTGLKHDKQHMRSQCKLSPIVCWYKPVYTKATHYAVDASCLLTRADANQYAPLHCIEAQQATH